MIARIWLSSILKELLLSMQQLCNGVSMLLMGNKLDVRNGLRDRRLWNRARFWMQGQEGSRTRKKHPLLDPQLVMRDGRGFGLGRVEVGRHPILALSSSIAVSHCLRPAPHCAPDICSCRFRTLYLCRYSHSSFARPCTCQHRGIAQLVRQRVILSGVAASLPCCR